MKKNHTPKHMREDMNIPSVDTAPDSTTLDLSLEDGFSGANIAGVPTDHVDNLPPKNVHPLGIPVPDTDGGGEYIPIAGRGGIESIAPNGAIVRNPWSEQPEVTPDHEYTEEKEDLNLIQL